MAKVEDVTFPYELLIRGREDGSVFSYVQRRHVVRLDGEVMKDEVLQPVDIMPDTVAGSPFQALIGELLTASIADGTQKAATIAERDDLIERLELAGTNMAADIARLKAGLEEAAKQAALVKETQDRERERQTSIITGLRTRLKAFEPDEAVAT